MHGKIHVVMNDNWGVVFGALESTHASSPVVTRGNLTPVLIFNTWEVLERLDTNLLRGLNTTQTPLQYM